MASRGIAPDYANPFSDACVILRRNKFNDYLCTKFHLNRYYRSTKGTYSYFRIDNTSKDYKDYACNSKNSNEATF